MSTRSSRSNSAQMVCPPSLHPVTLPCRPNRESDKSSCSAVQRFIRPDKILVSGERCAPREAYNWFAGASQSGPHVSHPFSSSSDAFSPSSNYHTHSDISLKGIDEVVKERHNSIFSSLTAFIMTLHYDACGVARLVG